MLENEQNSIILKRLFDDSYTRDSISNLRVNLAKICNHSRKSGISKGFEAIKEFLKVQKPQTSTINKSNLSHSQQQQQSKVQSSQYRNSLMQSTKIASLNEIDPNSFVGKCIPLLLEGDKIQKFHYSSSGSRKEYFLIRKDGTLRWANSAAVIRKDSKDTHIVSFKDMRGIVYGHVTKTFCKGKNAKLKPWLCFSIILKNRPFDICCTEEQLPVWFNGLSGLLKLYNPYAFTIRYGRYLWSRMKFVMFYRIMDSVSEANKKKMLARGKFSFTKTIILYAHLKKMGVLKIRD